MEENCQLEINFLFQKITTIFIQKVKRDAGVDTLVESIDQLANRIFGEADWDRLPELFRSEGLSEEGVAKKEPSCICLIFLHLSDHPGDHLGLEDLRGPDTASGPC